MTLPVEATCFRAHWPGHDIVSQVFANTSAMNMLLFHLLHISFPGTFISISVRGILAAAHMSPRANSAFLVPLALQTKDPGLGFIATKDTWL